jgi:hypothetical protein
MIGVPTSGLEEVVESFTTILPLLHRSDRLQWPISPHVAGAQRGHDLERDLVAACAHSVSFNEMWCVCVCVCVCGTALYMVAGNSCSVSTRTEVKDMHYEPLILVHY